MLGEEIAHEGFDFVYRGYQEVAGAHGEIGYAEVEEIARGGGGVTYLEIGGDLF